MQIEKREREAKLREEGIRKEKAQEERNKKIEDYWLDHAEEKSQLTNKKTQLSSQYANILTEKNSNTLPIIHEISILSQRELKLVEEKNLLGKFRLREKQNLQQQIDDIRIDLSNKNSNLRMFEEKYGEKLKQLQSQINRIDQRLN